MSIWTKKFRRMYRKICAQRSYERKDHLKSKQDLAFRIQEHSSFGWTRVCWTSTDCDGYRVSGRSEVVPAMVSYVSSFVDRLYENAEGPLSWWLEVPQIKPVVETRDLGMEAFENGHPHVLRG